LLIFTTGVLPMVPRMLSNLAIALILAYLVAHTLSAFPSLG
jgi:hypothetical protein